MQILVETGRINDAEEMTGLFCEAEKAAAVADLATIIERIDFVHALALFDKAWELALALDDPIEKTEALCDLALVLMPTRHESAAEALTEAERIASSIPDIGKRSHAFGILAAALVRSGRDCAELCSDRPLRVVE